MGKGIGPKIEVQGENDYKKSLQGLVQQTKTLDAQMKALASTFDEETGKMGDNEKRTELLQKKKEALSEEVKLIEQRLEEAKDAYGENSTQVLKLEASLAKAETALNNVNNEMRTSAMDDLTSSIEDQQSELDALKDKYVEAVLEFGNGSDEANELAGRISELSGALQENRGRMADARSAADGLDQSLGDVSEAETSVSDTAQGMAGVFGGAIGGMVTAITSGDVFGLVSQIVGVMQDVTQASIDMRAEFDDTIDAIVAGTGATGDALDTMRDKAEAAWAAVANEGRSMSDVGGTLANLSTRFGWDEQEAALQGATEAMETYAKVTGEDAASAVNQIADVMARYGMISEDSAATTENLYGLLDKFATASTLADVSLSDMTGFLSSNQAVMEELGMSMDDAIAYMINFRQAGGDVSTLSTSMTKAVSALSEAEGDLGTNFELATLLMGGTADTTTKLNAQIGNTGVTIEKAFGKKNAQDLISVFTAMNNSTRDWAEGMQNADGAVSQMYKDSISLEDGWSQAKAALQTEFGLPSGITDLIEKFPEVKESLASAAQESSKNISDFVGSVDEYGLHLSKSTDDTGKDFQELQTDITSAMNTSKRNVQNAMNDMKNAINTDLGHPNLYEVTYTASGSFGSSGSVTYSPSYRRKYAKAYGSPVLLNGATVFGGMNGGLLSGGEYGTEVVVGESYLLDAMTSAVQRAFGYIPAAAGSQTNTTYEGSTINVYGAPGQDVKELARLVGDQINKSVRAKVAVHG